MKRTSLTSCLDDGGGIKIIEKPRPSRRARRSEALSSHGRRDGTCSNNVILKR